MWSGRLKITTKVKQLQSLCFHLLGGESECLQGTFPCNCVHTHTCTVVINKSMCTGTYFASCHLGCQCLMVGKKLNSFIYTKQCFNVLEKQWGWNGFQRPTPESCMSADRRQLSQLFPHCRCLAVLSVPSVKCETEVMLIQIKFYNEQWTWVDQERVACAKKRCNKTARQQIFSHISPWRVYLRAL